MSNSRFRPVRTLSDVHAIEAQPYEHFMPWNGLYEALCSSAERYGHHPAMTLLADDASEVAMSWSYAQLLEKVSRTGNAFRALAKGATSRVAMLLPAIPQAYATLWGAASVGTICPINYLLRKEHIAELLQVADCNVIVALGVHDQLDISSKVLEVCQACPSIQEVVWVGSVPEGAPGISFDALTSSQSSVLTGASSGEDIAALFHTGGTTGSPKLAQHTHRNQLHAAAGAAGHYALTSSDCIVNGMPLFHVAGTIVFGLSTILTGGHIVLPTALGMRNPVVVQNYWATVAKTKASLITATPTGIATLLSASRKAGDTTGVRALLTGGAPLPPELALEFERETAIPVRNTFGMTECCGVVSIEPVLAPRKSVSCGLRIPFTEVQIATMNGVPVAEGASGIMRLRGPNVSPGYTDMVRDSGTFEGGWLVSGDLARIRDDCIEVTGRSKDVIIRNTHNIDPQQIEEALLKHPGVLMAAAVGQPDEYAGELPVAFVVAKPGFVLNSEELLAFSSMNIAERPAQPKRIDVIEALPQTAVGKIYKPALRRIALERSIQERLVDAGLASDFSVNARDEAHGLCVDFVLSRGPLSPLTQERLKALMRCFSYEWSISSTAPSTQ
ncbi:AMP-binding protein [Comamonas sp. Tr-654]|uniref:AMP-binding protein n=1 Tax=Comamonas sp. Tr-654 TaxID=2608341 RepID=UPI00141E3960|nr:AMP-binding protein [Comamonas sp. Tr-654]